MDQLDGARRDFELYKEELDVLVGQAIHASLSAEEIDHLNQLKEAGVLLSPKVFYRIRWFEFFDLDREIDGLNKAINNAHENQDASPFIERARLLARKRTQPYWVLSHLREATEIDPKIEIDSDLLEAARVAGETIDRENNAFNPEDMRDMYLDSLKLKEEELET